jgi:hypothetical protein
MASQAMKRLGDAVARAARRDEIEMQAMRIEVSDRARSADAPSRLATLARGLGRVGPPRGTISYAVLLQVAAPVLALPG